MFWTFSVNLGRHILTWWCLSACILQGCHQRYMRKIILLKTVPLTITCVPLVIGQCFSLMERIKNFFYKLILKAIQCKYHTVSWYLQININVTKKRIFTHKFMWWQIVFWNNISPKHQRNHEESLILKLGIEI